MKTKILMAIILLLFLSTVYSTATIVQHKSSYADTIVFDTNVTAGNVIVVAVSTGEATTIPSVADNKSNTYIRVNQVLNPEFAPTRLAVFYVQSAIAGTNTITITGDADKGGGATEISGLADSNIVDANKTNTYASPTTNPKTGTITTSQRTLIYSAFAEENSGGTATKGATYTLLGENDTHFDFQQYKIVDAGTYDANITGHSSTSWASSLVAFKEKLSTTCIYSGSGDWLVNLADNCNLTTNTDLGANKFYTYGVGSLILNAYINTSEAHLIGANIHWMGKGFR